MGFIQSGGSYNDFTNKKISVEKNVSLAFILEVYLLAF